MFACVICFIGCSHSSKQGRLCRHQCVMCVMHHKWCYITLTLIKSKAQVTVKLLLEVKASKEIMGHRTNVW